MIAEYFDRKIFHRGTQYSVRCQNCHQSNSVDISTLNMKIFLILAAFVLLLATWAEAKRRPMMEKREVWRSEVCSEDGQIFQSRRAALAAGKKHLCSLGADDCYCLWLKESSLDDHYDYWHWQMVSNEKNVDERKFHLGAITTSKIKKPLINPL